MCGNERVQPMGGGIFSEGFGCFVALLAVMGCVWGGAYTHVPVKAQYNLQIAISFTMCMFTVLQSGFFIGVQWSTITPTDDHAAGLALVMLDHYSRRSQYAVDAV